MFPYFIVVVDSTDKEFEDILQQLNALGNTIDQELSQVPGKFSKTSSTTTTLNNHQKSYPLNSINGDSNGITDNQQQQQSSDMIMINTLSATTTSPSSSSSTSYPSSNNHYHPYSIHSFHHHHHSHSIHDDDNDSTNQILTVVGMCLFDWIKIFPCKFYFYVFP